MSQILTLIDNASPIAIAAFLLAMIIPVALILRSGRVQRTNELYPAPFQSGCMMLAFVALVAFCVIASFLWG